MIQRHGIGVIHSEEKGSHAARNTYLPTSESRMTKVINLRSARKRAIRLQDQQHAAERRAFFGMPVVERRLVKARGKKARQDLEAHRIEDGEGR